jgi:hypothetical protein
MALRRQAGAMSPMTARAVVAGVVALLVVGCLGHVAGADDPTWGPFRGRFVDADTGEPIRGAVAYAIWLELVPNPVHGTQRFYDVRFAVSNEAGEFEIPARPKPILFPSGYEGPFLEVAAPRYQLRSLTKAKESHYVVELRSWSRMAEGERRSAITYPLYTNFIPAERRLDVLNRINTTRNRMGLQRMRTLEGGSE